MAPAGFSCIHRVSCRLGGLRGVPGSRRNAVRRLNRGARSISGTGCRKSARTEEGRERDWLQGGSMSTERCERQDLEHREAAGILWRFTPRRTRGSPQHQISDTPKNRRCPICPIHVRYLAGHTLDTSGFPETWSACRSWSLPSAPWSSMAHWMITLVREGAAIVIPDEDDGSLRSRWDRLRYLCSSLHLLCLDAG